MSANPLPSTLSPLQRSHQPLSHSRTVSTSSIDSDIDDLSHPPVDVNAHLPPSSVRDRLNFWKANEQLHTAAQSRAPSRAHSRQPSRSRTFSPVHSHSPSTPDLPLLSHDISPSDKKSVKDAFLIRLQLAQSAREDEDRRRHDAAYQSELQTAKQAKHRAQESLQLKITVDSAASSPALSPRPRNTPSPSTPLTPSAFDSESLSSNVSPLIAPAPPPRPPPSLLHMSPSLTPSPPAISSPPPISATTSSPPSNALPPQPDPRPRSASSPTPPTPRASLTSPSSVPTPPSPSPSPSSTSTPAPPVFPIGVDDPHHRALIVSEIITSEATYVSSLSNLITHYLQPLKAVAALTPADVATIFGGVELLYNFHLIFLGDLRGNEGEVAKVVLRLCDFLKMYTAYLQNYTQALTTIDAQRKNKAFQTIVGDARRRCGLDLMSYLIMPVQRVPRYELLLRELMRYTPELHTERPTLCAALTKIQSIAHHINASARHAGEMSKLIEIQNSISGEFGTLLLPHRRLIKEGSVMKMKGEGGVLGGGGGGRRLIVFNDIIIWTSEGGRFRGHTRLEGMTVEGWEDKKGKIGFVLRAEDEVKGGKQERVFVCATQGDCEEWVVAIGDVCQQERRRSGTLKLGGLEVKVRGVQKSGGGAEVAGGAAGVVGERRISRNGGRETHQKLMDSLKELKAKGEGSRRGKAGGDEEEKEAAEEEVDVSRVRRRGSFNSVSMSVSPYAAAQDEE